MNDIQATTTPEPRDDQARWDARYRAREATAPAAGQDPPGPPDALLRLSSLLPARGRVIDLAGGDGGGALFLAARGLGVTVADVSPVALARAEGFARVAQVELDTAAVDLTGIGLGRALADIGGVTPAAITCWNYLSRPLLASVADELPSGCRFLVGVATTTNLERNERPSARFLLEPGELTELVVGAVPTRLRVLHRREGWAADRHRAELVVEAR